MKLAVLFFPLLPCCAHASPPLDTTSGSGTSELSSKSEKTLLSPVSAKAQGVGHRERRLCDDLEALCVELLSVEAKIDAGRFEEAQEHYLHLSP